MLWRSTHLGRARSRRDFHIDGSVVDQWIGLLGSSLSRLMSRLGTRATAGFPAFHYRDLRVLGLGSALGSLGQFGEVIALGWLVLDRTDSPFMVGLAFSLQALPSLFGIPAGALADSVDRRRLLPLSPNPPKEGLGDSP